MMIAAIRGMRSKAILSPVRSADPRLRSIATAKVHGCALMTETQVKERPILFNGPMVRATLDGRKTQTRRVVKEQHLQVNLPQRVTSDLPTMFSAVLVAPPGLHRVKLNPHGAVFIPFPDGQTLGVKPDEYEWVSPQGKPGDRLWVRETHAFVSCEKTTPGAFFGPDRDIFDLACERPRNEQWFHVVYAADPGDITWEPPHFRPSIHMPRWASRILLEVTKVRVERLRGISEEDAIAEGIRRRRIYTGQAHGPHTVYGLGTDLDHAPSAVDAYRDLWESINGQDSWSINPWVWVLEFKLVEGR